MKQGLLPSVDKLTVERSALAEGDACFIPSSPDPVPRFDGSYDQTNLKIFNRYAYTQNDPVNFVDPSGLMPPICYHSTGDPGGWICVQSSGQAPWGGFTGGAVAREPDKSRRRTPQTRGGGRTTDAATKSLCPPKKQRFFNWLSGPLTV